VFTLETNRLILKPHTLDNLALMHEWENDPELNYYNSEQPEDRQPDTLDQTRQYLEHIAQQRPGQTLHYAIHRKVDSQLIGYGMIGLLDVYNRRCHLGINIADRTQWGQGLGKETMAGVIRYCFTHLDLNRVGGEVYSFNTRSIRLFEGLGFTREGVVRQSVWKRGAFADEYIYGLLRHEWHPLT
jgi:[ribosomal protein S5]-alanine N-acetyltransferase